MMQCREFWEYDSREPFDETELEHDDSRFDDLEQEDLDDLEEDGLTESPDDIPF